MGDMTATAGNMSTSDVNLKITSQNPKPPSYESLFESIKKAKSGSDTFLDYLRDVTDIIKRRLGTYGLLVLGIFVGLGIFLFPLIEVIVGSLHIQECEAERNIPVYLILVGILVLVASTCCCTGALRHRYAEGKGDEGDLLAHRCTRGCSLLIYFICFILLIIGSAWIYGIQGKVQFVDKDKPYYCQQGIYHFAYYTTILKWLFFCVGTLLGTAFIGMLCCIFMVKEGARD